MKRIHGLDELFGIRTRVLTVSGQRGNKAGKPDTQKSVSFCRGGRPIRSEISFFPLDGRSSTTSSRARDSNESGCRTNCRCRYRYFPDGMPVSVTLPRLHSTRAKSPNRGRGIRPNHRHFVFHAPEESYARMNRVEERIQPPSRAEYLIKTLR